MPGPLDIVAEGAKTAVGFFWKAGWAFVLGYAISGMIQAFVPKGRLTPYMGGGGLKGVSIATGFGAASSSCSFAALSAARAVFHKGAHFIATVAFMFASTNLVIELGILIFIFLGWQFLVAEIIGGILLIALSATIIKLTYPRSWIDQARQKVEEEAPDLEDDFDWRQRVKSRQGWEMASRRFVGEWGMVWEEILIGFTVAGFVAVAVPKAFWTTIFLTESDLPGWLVVIENAIVGPLVAVFTFIGSMGNIPLATVLSAHGVLFAGIMAFIYSDLIVPPIVSINAGYYGRRVAAYIVAVMVASIVATALILHGAFEATGLTPESQQAVEDIVQFKLDYTFWLNLALLFLAGAMSWLAWKHSRAEGRSKVGFTWSWKRVVALLAGALLLTGLVLMAFGFGGPGQ